MKYEIEVVGNDELKGQAERVIVERTNGEPLLIVTRRAAATWLFLQAWQNSRHTPAEVVQLLRAV